MEARPYRRFVAAGVHGRIALGKFTVSRRLRRRR